MPQKTDVWQALKLGFKNRDGGAPRSVDFLWPRSMVADDSGLVEASHSGAKPVAVGDRSVNPECAQERV